MARAFMWLAIWCCFCAMIAMLAVGCAGNAEKELAGHGTDQGATATRVTHSDECAWENAGHDSEFRAKLHELAIAADPERSFLMNYPETGGSQI